MSDFISIEEYNKVVADCDYLADKLNKTTTILTQKADAYERLSKLYQEELLRLDAELTTIKTAQKHVLYCVDTDEVLLRTANENIFFRIDRKELKNAIDSFDKQFIERYPNLEERL